MGFLLAPVLLIDIKSYHKLVSMRQEAVKSLNLIYFLVSCETGSTKINAVISVELISFSVACCPLIKSNGSN